MRCDGGAEGCNWKMRDSLLPGPPRSEGSKEASIAESEEGGRKFGDGFKEEVGLGGAQALLRGERAEDSDGGADAGAASHLQVFWRVTDIDRLACAKAHVAKREAQRGWMRFAEPSISAADASGELMPEIEIMELAMDAVAVAAGDKAQSVSARKLLDDAARTGQKFGAMLSVVFAPEPISGVIFGARNVGGTIDVVPVGRVIAFEIGEAPRNLQRTKHGEIGGGVRGVGVEERAIPVKKDAAERRSARGGFHELRGYFTTGGENGNVRVRKIEKQR